MVSRESGPPRLLYAALIVCYVITLGCMLYAGEPAAFDWWKVAVFFFVWTGVPYLALAFTGSKLAGAGASRSIVTVGAIVLGIFGLVLLWHSLVVEPDAQGGLVFVALPLFQLVGVIPLALAAWLVERRLRGNRVHPGHPGG